ncbi:MAG: hypothetical protein WBI57_09040 [Desulfobacterales bacterium]
MKKNRCLNVFLIAIVISGCASWQKNYGKLKTLPKDESEVIIRDLIDKWEDFDIYYTSSGTPLSFGIMFDPKDNDTALVGDMWKKVADKETFLKTVKWIKHDRLLKEIIGPDGRFYGYIYFSYGHVTLKMMGDKKMYVFSLEPKIGN